MAEPNFKPRTVWTGDNLDMLRGINSECVDLIYLDPPFNSNRSYSAPIGSQVAGAAFKDTWTLDDVDEAWLGEIADREPWRTPRRPSVPGVPTASCRSTNSPRILPAPHWTACCWKRCWDCQPRSVNRCSGCASSWPASPKSTGGRSPRSYSLTTGNGRSSCPSRKPPPPGPASTSCQMGSMILDRGGLDEPALHLFQLDGDQVLKPGLVPLLNQQRPVHRHVHH